MKHTIIVILLCFCATVYAEEGQYVCEKHGFVDTEIITYNGMEFQLCRPCIDEFIENNSDSIAGFMERAWRGDDKERIGA